jgi:serine protease AprX
MRRRLFLSALITALIAAQPAQPLGQRGPTVSADLAVARGDRVRVIVQADAGGLSWLRSRHARNLRRHLSGAVALDVSKSDLESLKRDSTLLHISGDLRVKADMAITNKVTGADRVWQGTKGLLGLLGTPGFNGDGIGVAVLDSGIAPHSALGNRVVARVNLVSDEPGVVGDPFGHGTHVAGLIGGSDTWAAPQSYSGGSAPRVKLVDVRVLGRTGTGYTSEVIAGIDWVIANRQRYGIRVINLSLGHAVAESAATDPLCRAVSRAAAAGIVVVASAGNYGRTEDGAPVLGGITSPGNSPDAITVGAIDTNGTVDRSDDAVAPYSSRGPTRFDFAVKPDVLAPGSRIVSAEAAGSYIATTYPAWHVAGSGKNSYGRLSGTSMSAAVVSGGIALLLDAEPQLSPRQVKIVLQSGARFVYSGGLISGGTGSVDFLQSLKMAQTGLIPSLLNTLESLLGLSSGASFLDTGTLVDRLYNHTGLRLLGILDLGGLLGGADTAESGLLTLIGLNNPIASVGPNHVVWGNYATWTGSYYIAWGTPMQDPASGQHVVWGNMTDDDGEHVVWGNSMVGQNDR